MKSRFIVKQLAALAIILTAGSALAAEKYCLKDICLGDPLSKHASRFKIGDPQLAELPVPYCGSGLMPQSRQFEAEADGMTYNITVEANPASAGKPKGEYYEVTSIGVFFPQVSQAEIIRSGQAVAARYKNLRPGSVTTEWRTSPKGNPVVTLTAKVSHGVAINPRSGLVLTSADTTLNPRTYEKQAGCSAKAPKL